MALLPLKAPGENFPLPFLGNGWWWSQESLAFLALQLDPSILHLFSHLLPLSVLSLSRLSLFTRTPIIGLGSPVPIRPHHNLMISAKTPSPNKVTVRVNNNTCRIISCKAGDPGSIPGSGRSPGGKHGNSLQYYCLEIPMDRGAWRPTVHGIAKSKTQLSN